MLLNIQTSKIGADVVIVGVTGRITLGRECQEVEYQLEDLLKTNQKKIIFDFSKLEYLDSTGIGIIVMCAGKAKQAGGELRVAGAYGIVEQTLKMTSVNQILALYPSVDAAAESWTGGSVADPA
jgi:anti-sigma B factor antagonist